MIQVSAAAPRALRLHGYWRSSAAYRVRIALELKGLAYETIAHDLRTGAQSDPGFRALGRQGLVPVLEGPDQPLMQSLAIIEWLEEQHPAPPLLPANAGSRAIVRSMASLIACDIHPLNNLRVLQTLRQTFGASEIQVTAWIQHWIADGFDALETLVSAHGAGYAFGETPTLADCCLVPQVYSAVRFGLDLAPWPGIARAAGTAADHPAFRAARPEVQPDAD